jgi:hypothetical protein
MSGCRLRKIHMHSAPIKPENATLHAENEKKLKDLLNQRSLQDSGIFDTSRHNTTNQDTVSQDTVCHESTSNNITSNCEKKDNDTTPWKVPSASLFTNNK